MARTVLAPIFKTKPGQFDQFLIRVQKQRDECLKYESGCLQFDVLVANDQPNTVFLYEIYEDEAAIEAHRTYDHYARFRSDTREMIESVIPKTWTIAD